MSAIWDIIKLLLPFLLELLKILKGAPVEAVRNAKKRCEGVGCPPDVKNSVF